tara:strand:- start:2717 stop:3139 length:423 start_codon:yes stop_codon:yes gene_type:complete
MKTDVMAEVSLIRSFVTCKCPKCRRGKVFTHKNPYHRKFGEIEKKCSVCNFIYEMEQGFWYGAMYFSYAFGVLISIPIVVLLLLKSNLEIFQITGVIFCVLVVLSPILFRYSRSAWLHIFVWYDKAWAEKGEDKKKQCKT